MFDLRAAIEDSLIAGQVKGGPGSGYEGHGGGVGGPGNPGGSRPRSAVGAGTQGPTFTVMEPGRGHIDPKVIADWEGLRHNYARNAIKEFNQGPAYDDDAAIIVAEVGGETVGVASFSTPRGPPGKGIGPPDARYVGVRWLATKRRGHGRQIMHRVAEYAASKGQGVHLGAADKARGFYEKIGMSEVVPGKGVFYWTPQEVQERVGRKAMDDLSELEPEDGVFTIGPIENEVKGIIIEGETWADVYFQAVEVAEWASVGTPVEAVFTEDGQAVRVKGITLGAILDVGKTAGISFWVGYADKGGTRIES